MQESLLETTIPSQKDSLPPPLARDGATDAVNKTTLPYVLARHKSDDCYFDVRLTEVELTYFHSQRLVHQLSFRLDLARPFEDIKRIRSAQLTVSVENEDGSSSNARPEILAITPEASLIHIADHEVTTGQTVGLTAGAPPAVGGSLSANANLSWGDKTTFEGNRLVHGYIPSSNQAQWKMYEEARSKSGLPPVLYFLIVLRAQNDFRVKAQLHIHRWTGWRLFGFRKQVAAQSFTEGYLVKKDLLVEPGQKAFQVSDDLLKLLDESDKRREILEDLIRKHFPRLKNAAEEMQKVDKSRSISKKTKAIVQEAREELESKFDLWRLMAESDVQQDALTMLYNIADKMLGEIDDDGAMRMRPPAIVPMARTDRIQEETMYDRSRMRERVRYEDSDRFERDRPSMRAEPRPTGNRVLFGKSQQTAEDALANHRAVSKSWNESKL